MHDSGGALVCGSVRLPVRSPSSSSPRSVAGSRLLIARIPVPSCRCFRRFQVLGFFFLRAGRIVDFYARPRFAAFEALCNFRSQFRRLLSARSVTSMSVVPLMPVVTGTKTASFLFLRTNTPCNSSLGLPFVSECSLDLSLFRLLFRGQVAALANGKGLNRNGQRVGSRGRRDPWRWSKVQEVGWRGGSWMVTTTLKSLASWLLDVDCAVETPVDRRIALLPISVTTPLNRCLGMASIDTSAGCPSLR